MAADRKLRRHRQCAHRRASAEVRRQGDAPAPPVERQNIPVEFTPRCAGPAAGRTRGQGGGAAQRHVLMINGLSGMLGDGAFNGWASVDIRKQAAGQGRSRLPAARIAMAKARAGLGRRRRGAMRTIDHVRAQLCRCAGAHLRREASTRRHAHSRRLAIEAKLASGVLKPRIANLGAYGGQATGDVTLDASGGHAELSPCSPTSSACARCRCCRASADFDRLDGKMQAKIAVRSTGTSQRAIMANMNGHGLRRCSRTARSAASMSRR